MLELAAPSAYPLSNRMGHYGFKESDEQTLLTIVAIATTIAVCALAHSVAVTGLVIGFSGTLAFPREFSHLIVRIFNVWSAMPWEKRCVGVVGTLLVSPAVLLNLGTACAGYITAEALAALATVHGPGILERLFRRY